MTPVLHEDQLSITIPARLPFLEAIGWALEDVRRLSLRERLSCYERGWRYRGILADIEGEELNFVGALSSKFGSWISGDV